jgi:hypothetical protein
MEKLIHERRTKQSSHPTFLVILILTKNRIATNTNAIAVREPQIARISGPLLRSGMPVPGGGASAIVCRTDLKDLRSRGMGNLNQ